MTGDANAARLRLRAQWFHLCESYLRSEEDRARGRCMMDEGEWRKWAAELRRALLDDLDAVR